MSTAPARERHTAEVGFGTAVVAPMGPTGWLLMVNRTVQSAVDPRKPAWMPFEYFRWMATVADAVAEPDRPLRVLHLGGGAMTIARYIHHIHPGAHQLVVEIDPALAEFVTERIPLPADADIEVRVADARDVVAELPEASFDLILGDAFEGTRLPEEMATDDYAAHIARVLRPDGLYGLNVFDSPTLDVARRQATALERTFGDWYVIGGPTHIDGSSRLNFCCAASTAPAGVPADWIARLGAEKQRELLVLPSSKVWNYFDELSADAARVESE